MRHPRNIALRALRGLAAGLLALCAACTTPPAPHSELPRGDTRVLQAATAARLAYEQGHDTQARLLYRQALTRAQAIDAVEQAADMAFNLAVVEVGLRHYEAADQLLAQAAYDAARVAAEGNDIRLLRAKLAYLRGQLPQALALANQVVSAGASPHLALQARILRGQMAADRRDPLGASSELQAVLALAAASGGTLAPAVDADLHKLDGTLARLAGRAAAAARLFDSEAQLLRSARRHRDMAHAQARAAESYGAAGQAALAADRYFLAARSLVAQADIDAARAYALASAAAAGQASDAAAGDRARRLLDELKPRDAR